MMKTRFAAALALSLSAGTIWAQELPSVASTVSAPATSEAVRANLALSVQGNDLTQNQWVKLSSEEGIRGSVVSIAKGVLKPQNKVSVFLVKDGQAVSEGTTDIDGDFILDHVEPGVYSLVVQSPNQLALLALTVLDEQSWYKHVSLIGRIVEIHDDVGLADIDRLALRYTGSAYPERAHRRVSMWMAVDIWHGWDATGAIATHADWKP
jgi:hypothetical protein